MANGIFTSKYDSVKSWDELKKIADLHETITALRQYAYRKEYTVKKNATDRAILRRAKELVADGTITLDEVS